MKISNNMLKHRSSLIAKKLECQSELQQVNNMISKLHEEYKEKCNSFNDLANRMECFRETFGNLPAKKNSIEAEIKYIENELLVEKYANMYGYTDVDPFEVVEERTPNLYIIRPMEAIQTEESINRMSESFVPCGFFGRFDNDLQQWDIKSNESLQTFPIRRHKDGNWYDAHHNRYVISSKPVKFYDYNF